jgi:hypothetical protein
MKYSRFHIKPGNELRSYSLRVADLTRAFVKDYTFFLSLWFSKTILLVFLLKNNKFDLI